MQYKDELISKKFPPDSGFEVTYRFTIDGAVPNPLWIVIERPDLYSITCNGTPVTAAKDSWWLDKAFGKIDITAAAKSGENAVTLKAQPFTMYHEIAAAFVLGEFSLRPTQAGFVIVPPQAAVDREGTGARDGHRRRGLDDGRHRIPARSGSQGRAMTERRSSPSISGGPVDLAAIEVWNYNEADIARARREDRWRFAGPRLSTAPTRGRYRWAPSNWPRGPGGPVGTKTAFAETLPVDGQEHPVREVHHPGESQRRDLSHDRRRARTTRLSGWAKCDSTRPARMASRSWSRA